MLSGVLDAEQRRVEVEVLQRAHVQVEVLLLETHADLRLYLGIVFGDVLAEDAGHDRSWA